MCSRVPRGSGLSRPISKPQTRATCSGTALALAGDTLAVGAPCEASNATGVNGNQTDNSAPDAGAVYVFTRTAGVWTQQAYLKASNTDAGDRFGQDLALDGDTLAVGARFEASAATGSMAIKPTIVRPTPERPMSSRGPVGSGPSKPISKPQTLEQIKISAVALPSREISWPLAHGSRIAMRPGSMAIRETVTRLTAARSMYSRVAVECGHRRPI